MASTSPLLLNKHFVVQAESFHFEGSATHSQTEQRIYVFDGGAKRTRQVILQMQSTSGVVDESRAIDGVAPEGDLLVVSLQPKVFFETLEALYEARREAKTITLTLDSDREGRIAKFRHNVIVASESPPGEAPTRADTSEQSETG